MALFHIRKEDREQSEVASAVVSLSGRGRCSTLDRLEIFLIVLFFTLIPLVLGIIEKRQNEKNLQQLAVRINVNGIRGKSTATRMIFSVLREAGYNVVGKTTGTAARLMYWDEVDEEPIPRKPRGVSISEQLRVIDKAVKHGADALVCECMAVRPDYQKVYQHQIIKAQITVIVNVLEDHLDEMGPTLEQLAWAFADTIPYDGIAVIPNCEFTDYFKQVARERGSKAVVIKPEIIPEELLKHFNYKVFPNNCAVALFTCMQLGIPMETIVRGILKAPADPGALQIQKISSPRLTTWFVNAFAANEPTSTLEIYGTLQDEELPLKNPVVVMNCRPDRVDRSTQFAEDCFPYMPGIQLVVIGEKTHPLEEAYRKGKLHNVSGYYNLQDASVPEIMDVLVPLLNNHILIGVGNIHGIGEEFIEAVHSLGTVTAAAQ